MSSRMILALIFLSAGPLGTAHAQLRRDVRERNAAAGEVMHDRAKLADDARDLQRFRQTLAAFDAALSRKDGPAVRAALQSFVAQGRAEVAEQRRETTQSAREAVRSADEARRDQTGKDRRDARDDRRDLKQDRRELMEEETLLGELERSAGAEIAFGPRPRILLRAREVMVRFTQLAEVELRRSRQELHEDRRELREDQRDVRRDRGR